MTTANLMETKTETFTENGYDDRTYQTVGTAFLRLVRRGFLTDDPGLGKTRQAIDAAELPCMVLAPRYICGQWEDSIRRADPNANIILADGSRKARTEALKGTADWYILNYEMIKSYEVPTDIKTFINDESQHLRNRRADKTKAVKWLENVDPTSRIYHLSATPFWKNVDDIWMQLNILYPSLFSSYRDFVKTYCIALNSPYGPKILGIKKAMRAGLKQLLQPIMLGRTYADVGRYLPEAIETVVRLDMSPLMKAMYDKLITDYSLKYGDEDDLQRLIFQPSTVLHALRQVTFNSGKIDAVLGILDDNRLGDNTGISSNNTPAVIGCWYRDHAKMMFDAIGPKNAVLITGDVPGIERQRLAMWAQNNGKHIVATQKSLSEGVNLYKYRLFICAEEDYVPGSNHQFVSRVIRDRNDDGLDKSPVRVYCVHAGAIDGHIHRVSRTRKTSIEATRELLELTLKKK